MTILVVDDDEQSLRTLKRLLDAQGHNVQTALGGQAGLDAVEHHNLDLVITDIQMVGLDGVALLRYIREAYPSLPVVLMTGYPTLDTAIEGLKLGARDYLQKPMKVEELLACIEGISIG